MGISIGNVNFLFFLIILTNIVIIRAEEVGNFVWPWEQQEKNFCIIKEPYICISLGSDCEIFWQLKRVGLRRAAFPFDWLLCNSSGSISKALDNDFKNFIKDQYLEEVGEEPSLQTKVILNTFYNILFIHDFKKQETLEQSLLIKDKFLRRIARFMSVLNLSVILRKSVYLFRKKITRDEAYHLTNIINKKWPNLIYKLVVLDSSDEVKKEWGIQNVRQFYLAPSNEMVNNWTLDKDWEVIFQNLGLNVRIEKDLRKI